MTQNITFKIIIIIRHDKINAFFKDAIAYIHTHIYSYRLSVVSTQVFFTSPPLIVKKISVNKNYIIIIITGKLLNNIFVLKNTYTLPLCCLWVFVYLNPVLLLSRHRP